MRLEGRSLEVVRFPEQAKAATANTKATENIASRQIRLQAISRINGRQAPARAKLERKFQPEEIL